MSRRRIARIRALAKINLDLRVLGKRPDGFHELRTVFQTISLSDIIEIAFTPAPKTHIELGSNLEIPDNLMTRAAAAALAAMRVTGHVEMRLDKRIPMGAGLGGGSSDAAAVLLALPALAGRRIGFEQLSALAAQLGSDINFFFLGGTAVGLGRGTEIYPVPDAPSLPGVLVAPEVHVSTPEAYRRLSPRLTSESQENKIVSFQSRVWDAECTETARNDFETVVFEQFPRLRALKRQLIRAGARTALMSGSGSSLFGLFDSRGQADRALELFGKERAFPLALVSRARYRSLWWRTLREHITPGIWPPQSRYER